MADKSNTAAPLANRTSTRRLRSFVFLMVVACAAVWIWKSRKPTATPAQMAGMHAHPNNPDMGAEHAALLELMPSASLATHVAVQDGAWSEPSTWNTGQLPGKSAIVLIPKGRDVTYSGSSAQDLFIVRVDGCLRIEAPKGMQTQMVVDTLFSMPESELSIEAAAEDAGRIHLIVKPFDIEAHKAAGGGAWSARARKLYSDGAPVTWTKCATVPSAKAQILEDGAGALGRYGWDPKQLSIGLIVHGSGIVHGKSKLSKAKIEPSAKRGDTALLLSEDPKGWSVGDRVVITGTHYVGRHLVSGAYTGTQDELRTILSIDGRKISFEPPLEYEHDTPRQNLHAYVANLTRNIAFQSSSALSLDDFDASSVSEVASNYGHVMFMHNDQASVRFASFDGLGRTDKTYVADDFRMTDAGVNAGRQVPKGGPRSANIRTKVHQIRNPRGRYALHMHRTGASEHNNVALVEGCVVTGGPGWGIVSHDSRADLLNNVTYGVLGAGYVAETGNETGDWTGNIAINTYGSDFNSFELDPHGLFQFENGSFMRTVLLEKRSSWKNHDFGHFGDGFWFQGKIIEVRNNVSVSSGLEGYFYMFRAPDQIKIKRDVVQEPLSIHSPNGIHPMGPGLNVFEGNESIADRGGLAMIGIGGGRTSEERSVIRNFTAWEVGEDGTHAQYYPGYTIRDSTFLASTSPDANPSSGVLLEKVQLDTVLANLTIEGFPHQYVMHKSWSPGTRGQQGLADPYEVIEEAKREGRKNPLPLGYAHVLINPGFTRAEAADESHMGHTFRQEDTILQTNELKLGRLEIELEDDSLRINLDHRKIRYGYLPPDPIRPNLQKGHVLLLRGIKTDSIGSIPINYHNNVLVWHQDGVQERLETQGYFQMPNGALGVILEEVFADRYTAERKVVRFVAELDARWDLSNAIDSGPYPFKDFPDVYVPAFLISS